MRTTVEISDELMESLAERLPGATKREAIETAIRGYLLHEAYEGIRKLRGKLDIEDVSAELRKIDRHS